MFNNLRKLSLSRVRVSEITMDRIISSCPLIEHVSINQCDGLGDIKVSNNALKLKCFDFVAVREEWSGFDHYTIEIDAPNIECIRISYRVNWLHSANYSSFTNLKSLHLCNVLLSENSFYLFSVDFSCLEELTLLECWGFNEFKLASCSIKNLSLYLRGGLRKASIDVPTIRCFELSFLSPPSISFTTASSEWKSKIIAKTFDTLHLLQNGPSSLLLDIYQFHKTVLCHSEFSLHITSPFGFLPRNVSVSPVVIENLTMDVNTCVFPLGAWLSHLFCIFRPQNIQHFWYANPENDSEGVNNLFVECLREFLVKDNQPGLEQVLEEELSNEHGNEAECGLLDSRKQKIRFRLKWRESRSLLPRKSGQA